MNEFTDNFFNSHYIRVDEHNRIFAGFSNAFQQPEPDDILINPEGGYQFRLFSDGEENPQLIDEHGIPLYRWDGEKVIKRTTEELQADRDAIPLPELTIPMETRIKHLEEVIEIIVETLPHPAKAQISAL